MAKNKDQSGFTVVELLIVVAIIGTLSSITIPSLLSANEKAKTARKIADVTALQRALINYKIATGSFPPNPTPCCGLTSGSVSQWNATFAPLVSGGYLASIPFPPDSTNYAYYDYGPGSIGMLVLADQLVDRTPSLSTPPPSSRLFTSNWCSYTIPSKEYCIFTPY